MNGSSTRGLVIREKLLQQAEPDSRAYQLNHFISLHKEEGLKEVKGKRVVYLYHDRIDATGIVVSLSFTHMKRLMGQ